MLTSPGWWRNAVVYQIYVRSFADGNGDGTGDLEGLQSRLDYLADLGVDAVWITPWYESPLRDGGYDVADFRKINELFGTNEQAETLIDAAHARGIKVIADLVPNHTSSDHEWFQEALDVTPGDPARDRYIFRAGRGADGEQPPTDWTSVFGGSAWERVDDGEWYLHLFDASQPDLNWESEDVRAEFDDIFRFWLDRGIDGFRIDVAHGLIKDQTFPDVGDVGLILESVTSEDHPFWDRDGVHEINRRWRALLDGYPDRMMVAEAWVAAHRLPLYLRADEYHQSFNFDLLGAAWDAAEFREVIDRSVTAAEKVGASSTWVLSNHDVMRHPTRYGLPEGVDWREWARAGDFSTLDPVLGLRRARAAALVTLSLPGSAYVYQGEELGLPQVLDLPDELIDDPTWVRSGGADRGRDGCRIPIPWTTDGESLGFGDAHPWLPQPANFGTLSVGAQLADDQSTLALYREAIGLRRAHLASNDAFELVDMGDDVLAYHRGDVVVVANMGTAAVKLPGGEVLIASGQLVDGELPANTAVWIR